MNLALHPLVEQIQTVTMVFALVYLVTKETLMKDVDQNVFLIRIVQKRKLVSETNVLILVPELVAKMLFVMYLITFQCADVQKA